MPRIMFAVAAAFIINSNLAFAEPLLSGAIKNSEPISQKNAPGAVLGSDLEDATCAMAMDQASGEIGAQLSSNSSQLSSGSETFDLSDSLIDYNLAAQPPSAPPTSAYCLQLAARLAQAAARAATQCNQYGSLSIECIAANCAVAGLSARLAFECAM